MFRFIYLFPLLFIMTSCGKPETTGSPRAHPNVIVILSDDQGWGDFSFTGNRNLHTPNIDRIARQGVYFENFYVQPVCSPTRAEFLTGRYAVRSGVFDTSEGGERIDIDETTIADLFKNAGYSTAAYGKWHSGTQFPYHPNGRGFEDFYGFCSGHWGNYFSPMLEHNGEIVQGNGYLPDDLTNHAIGFIEENRDKPFFLYLPYNTPHDPLQVPDEWFDKFDNTSLEMKADSRGEENPEFTRAVLAMCENIDWNVGRIMEKLEELDIDENTIIVYFNDNGPNSFRWNGGMKGRKGSTDEGGTRSPLLIRWPQGIEGGRKLTRLSAAIDLLPTLTGLAGIPSATKNPLDGISLVPDLMGCGEQTDRTVFNFWNGRLSVRKANYRLDQANQLFDIDADRAQRNDVQNAMPEIHSRLLAERDVFMNEILSELPEEDERTYPLGHPGTEFTHLPARDGQPHGAIRRSNRWPNCSFFTNWINTEDEITWDVEVVEDGKFEVMLYYTCQPSDTGAIIQLGLKDSFINKTITESFDPPLRGMGHDRVMRENSYVKDFKPLSLGIIKFEKGQGKLHLRALSKPGSSVIDVRLLTFRRIPEE